MAENCPPPPLCFYCLTEPPAFHHGWKLHCGNYAALCFKCSSEYNNGTFCDIHHSNSRHDGWRSCSDCGKALHCGCIMSAKQYVMLDTSGVQCMACFKRILLKRSRLPPPSQPSHRD